MSQNQHNIDPKIQAALNSEATQALREKARSGVEQGPLPSLQIALAVNGKLALFETFGEADNNTRYNIFSCTKPLVASAVWLLMGRGAIDIARPVAHYFTEFGDNGKEAVTIEQLLCHTSGFPTAPMGPPAWWTHADRIERMRTWYLEWEPGSRMVYHPTSAHWALAEVIGRITGQDFRAFIRDEIITPLGLDTLSLGTPAAREGDFATMAHVGEPPTPEELENTLGRAIDFPDMRDDSLLLFNRKDTQALGVPGGGGISTAADIALFYQALMRNEKDLWNADVLADATGRVRVNFPDAMTNIPANRGLGVVIAGDGDEAAFRGMGRTVSPRAFGHQGVGGQVAWGDPESGLSFCMLTNGLDVNPIRSARFCAGMNNRAGACLAR